MSYRIGEEHWLIVLALYVAMCTRSTAVKQDEETSIAAHMFIFGFNVHVSSFKYLHLPATDLSIVVEKCHIDKVCVL